MLFVYIFYFIGVHLIFIIQSLAIIVLRTIKISIVQIVLVIWVIEIVLLLLNSACLL